MVGRLTSVHESQISVFLSGTDVTFWVHALANVTLNGVQCKLTDLQPGDAVEIIGDPATKVIATRTKA